jgi:hypothetical protein
LPHEGDLAVGQPAEVSSSLVLVPQGRVKALLGRMSQRLALQEWPNALALAHVPAVPVPLHGPGD